MTLTKKKKKINYKNLILSYSILMRKFSIGIAKKCRSDYQDTVHKFKQLQHYKTLS